MKTFSANMRAFLLFLSLLLAYDVKAFFQDEQDYDSLSQVTVDTVESESEDIRYTARPDSLAIRERSFSNETLNSLRADPELNYKVKRTVGESFWVTLVAWLVQLISMILDKATNTNWGQVTIYLIGLALLVVVIMMLLKVNAFKVFYSGAGKNMKYQVVDENIHEMNFEQLIQEAMDRQDYRRGVRLLFLYALKLLSDRHLIQWESGKTNHEYARELGSNELKNGFSELSFYFDYAWYGNFAIDQAMFHKAQTTFTRWKSKLN